MQDSRHNNPGDEVIPDKSDSDQEEDMEDKEYVEDINKMENAELPLPSTKQGSGGAEIKSLENTIKKLGRDKISKEEAGVQRAIELSKKIQKDKDQLIKEDDIPEEVLRESRELYEKQMKNEEDKGRKPSVAIPSSTSTYFSSLGSQKLPEIKLDNPKSISDNPKKKLKLSNSIIGPARRTSFNTLFIRKIKSLT